MCGVPKSHWNGPCFTDAKPNYPLQRPSGSSAIVPLLALKKDAGAQLDGSVLLAIPSVPECEVQPYMAKVELQNKTTVSVILTTFNDARFLSEAIGSVYAQTHLPEEVIVVDDGSTEDPSAVVNAWRDVRLIRQTNRGLAAARNTGWRAAKGEYIVFLDADDRLRSTAIATNLAQFVEHPECGFVYGAYCSIDESGQLIKRVPLRKVGVDPFASFLEGNLIGMHATVMYRRECLERMNGFDEAMRASEDYDMYLRASQSYRVAYTGHILADYRQHSSNMSKDYAMMLERTIGALAKQVETARSRDDWWSAYRKGIEHWKKNYVQAQLSSGLKALKGGNPTFSVLRDSAKVVGAAPMVAAAAVGSFLYRRLLSLGSKPFNWGDLRRTRPFSVEFGFDRGRPIDRHYIEQFLEGHAADIKGRVLEIGDNSYTLRYGGDQVKNSEVLNRYPGESGSTYVGDLTHGEGLPSGSFDCVILTQTLHLVFDMQGAVSTVWRILRP
jgi:glycosyltransferase involved in cell wall biosynthesis